MNFEELFFKKFHSLMKMSSFKYILTDDTSIDKNSHKELAVAEKLAAQFVPIFQFVHLIFR